MAVAVAVGRETENGVRAAKTKKGPGGQLGPFAQCVIEPYCRLWGQQRGDNGRRLPSNKWGHPGTLCVECPRLAQLSLLNLAHSSQI